MFPDNAGKEYFMFTGMVHFQEMDMNNPGNYKLNKNTYWSCTPGCGFENGMFCFL